MAHDVFICHSSQDKHVADAVCATLEESGFACWIAPRDPVAGIPYARQIAEAIDKAAAVAFIFSENANRSEHVSRELEIASNAKKTIVPIRIEDVTPSIELQYYVARVHWFDAVAPPLEVRLAELVELMRGLLGKELSHDPRVERRPTSNLPRDVTSFVGREDEVAEVVGLLATASLVTLVGTGGVGKSRCALAAASRFSSKREATVWLVELGRIADGSLVYHAIASTLGIDERPGQPIVDTLIGALRRSKMLLILDNCEQVIGEAASIVAAILKRCPDVVILATSREALHVAGEHVVRLEALPQNDAIALFADRVTAVQPGFKVTAENLTVVDGICCQLEGVPLAIELAAAWMRTLPLRALAEKLHERFRLLTGGNRESLPRHQTLRAAIDWSYDLLAEVDRALFRKLSIFSGGFRAEQALAVAPVGERADVLDTIDALTSLVDKSLIRVDLSAEETRYSLLESMREYGREKLAESGEEQQCLRTHAIAYADLAEEMASSWDGTAERIWKERTQPELENWRAALKWAFSPFGDVEIGQRLAAGMRPVWFTFAPSEGRRWVAVALDAIGPQTPQLITAQLERNDAQLALLATQYKPALESARRALGRYTEAGDEFGQAEAQMLEGAALGQLARGNEAEPLLRQALTTFRRLGARRWIPSTLLYLGGARLNAGDPVSARRLFGEALQLYQEIGAERPAVHLALLLAEIEFQAGNAQTAVGLVENALAAERATRELDNVAFDLSNLAAYLTALDRWNEARACASEALALARERDIVSAELWTLQHLAAVATLRPGEPETVEKKRAMAARICGYVDKRLAELGLRRDFTEQQEYERMLESFAPLREGVEDLFGQSCNWSSDKATAEALAASAE